MNVYDVIALLALTAIGELIAEKSGVVNIGIEGITCMGAFVSVVATLLASYFFGFFDALRLMLAQVYGRQIPPHFFQMIPYLATVIIFAVFYKRSRPPAAIAQPYRRE